MTGHYIKQHDGEAPARAITDGLQYERMSEIERAHADFGYKAMEDGSKVHGFRSGEEYWVYGPMSDVMDFCQAITLAKSTNEDARQSIISKLLHFGKKH